MRKRIFAFILCLLTLVCFSYILVSATAVPTPLEILKQPTHARCKIGERITISVEASGDDLVYTWFAKDPGDAEFIRSTVTTNVYSFPLTEEKCGQQIYCVISDRYGNSVTTDTVTANERIELKIVKQPKSLYGTVGDTVTVKAVAQGEDLKYLWYVKDPGAKSFTKTSVTKATYSWKVNKKQSGRQVYCLVTDFLGNRIKTDVATLKMITPLQIKKQPAHAGAAAGKTVKTSVTAVGDGLEYRWYYKNPGMEKFKKTSVTSNTYSWKVTKKDSGRQVYCVITDMHGNKVKTNTVTLKIPKQLKITTQPKNVLAKLGTLGKVTVKAAGDKVQYRWYVKKQGETSFQKTSVTGKSYSQKMATSNVGTQAYCLITDMFGNKIKSKVVTFTAAKAEFDRTLYKVKPGAKRTVDLNIQPADTKDDIVWTSSNTKIAKVNSKGVITGVKYGTVTITARGKKTGFVASCQLKVCDVKQVAITFDDGPGKYTAELLDFLEENDIRVTFFLVGNRLSSYKKTVKQMVADGHEIGYHSWKHDIQTKLSNSKIKSDYKKAAKLLKNIAGAEFTLWRTPGGGKSDRVLKQIKLPHIMWSVDTLDWKYRDSSRTCKVIKNSAKDGSIVLLHDIHKTTVKGAMKALKQMQEGDYEFVTVTELLSRKGQTPKNSKSYSRG